MSIKVSYDITKLEHSVTPTTIKRAGTIVANQVVMDSERYVPQGKTRNLVGSGLLLYGIQSMQELITLVQMVLFSLESIQHRELDLNG